MYVECFKNNGIDYLRLVQSHRVKNTKGIKTARKKVVYNIGPPSLPLSNKINLNFCK